MVKAELLSCGSLWGTPCAPSYSSFLSLLFSTLGKLRFCGYIFFNYFGCAGSLLLHAGFL